MTDTPQKPRRQTPYDRVKDQLDIKTRECEQLQEANTGLSTSLYNVRKTVEQQTTSMAVYAKAQQRALSRRIHGDNYVNTLNERIAYLKRPWWSRSASYANQLRIASDMALDRINRFDMDKDPSAADAPGAIMGLDTRAGRPMTAAEQAQYSALPPQQITQDPSNYAARTQAQIAANGPYQAAARKAKFDRDGSL